MKTAKSARFRRRVPLAARGAGGPGLSGALAHAVDETASASKKRNKNIES